ncbi:hypothetical protein [Streptomyces sp. NPDC002540]
MSSSTPKSVSSSTPLGQWAHGRPMTGPGLGARRTWGGTAGILEILPQVTQQAQSNDLDRRGRPHTGKTTLRTLDEPVRGQDRTRDRCRERHGRCDGAAVTLVGQRADMLDEADLQIEDAGGRFLTGDAGNPAAVERALAHTAALFRKAHCAADNAV